MARRIGALLIALLLCLAFVTACDPYSPSDTGTAEVWVEVHPHARGSARVVFDNHMRSRAELLATGRAVAPLLFPKNTKLQVKIDPNGGGYPFIAVSASGIYADKPTTLWPFNARPASQYLLDRGMRSVYVGVWVQAKSAAGQWIPAGKHDQDGMWTWPAITEATQAPAGVVALDQ